MGRFPHQCFVSLPLPMESDPADLFPEGLKVDPDQFLRKQPWNLIRPFDGSDPSSCKILFETQIFCFFLRRQTEKIDVKKWNSSLVFVKECKRGGDDAMGPLHSNAGGEPLDEVSLP